MSVVENLQLKRHSGKFGARVFHHKLMDVKLDAANAQALAEALKDWAIRHGATHYTHWFQPLTNQTGEKHDSFFTFSDKGHPIEQLKGKDLLRGEPDASSFPSGGLRATHQARGYTIWDSSSPPFLMRETLFIPSLFLSWKGESLDYKIPLLRSDEKIGKAVLRLLHLCKIPAGKVYSTLGPEQEYFLIDKSYYDVRPDLYLAGRTVFGARPAKGQELEDHYFGSVKERVLAFMQEFEEAAIEVGIPVKTRHNEVAPAQFEAAPLFEKASLAVDHNLLLMELMRQIAPKHGLACLMHEKPFANLNGSGKHNNWSLATDTGHNLLDPKENSLPFLILLTAILRGVHEHAALLRASIASAGNDHRLGGNEAPPTILSVYLGEVLEKLVEKIIHGREDAAVSIGRIDLGISHVPHVEADLSDRNRTSFFAFTGNKFEFRAVGASANCSLPMTTLNAIVADSLHLILDEIQSVIKDQNLNQENAFPVLQKHLKASQGVLFGGNGYSNEWIAEAEARGLPNIRRSFHAFHEWTTKRTERVFEGILSEAELHSRYEVFVEQYAKTMNVETNLMIELFRTWILPASLQDQTRRGAPLSKIQKENLQKLTEAIDQAISDIDDLEKIQSQTADLGWEAKGKVFCELVAPRMDRARQSVDRLETLADASLWPLPKYHEMLYLL